MSIVYFTRRPIIIVGLYRYCYVECKNSKSNQFYYIYLSPDQCPKYRDLSFMVEKWEI